MMLEVNLNIQIMMEENNMKCWECIFKVLRPNQSLLVRDYIICTTIPTSEEVGHWWKSLFHDTVEVLSCIQVEIPTNMEVAIIPLAQEYHTASV